MTYFNTYLKDQPYFLYGLKVTQKGLTLYLNAYNERLFNYASAHHIKHGKGCYYFQFNQTNHVEHIINLIKISIN